MILMGLFQLRVYHDSYSLVFNQPKNPNICLLHSCILYALNVNPHYQIWILLLYSDFWKTLLSCTSWNWFYFMFTLKNQTCSCKQKCCCKIYSTRFILLGLMFKKKNNHIIIKNLKVLILNNNNDSNKLFGKLRIYRRLSSFTVVWNICIHAKSQTSSSSCVQSGFKG